MELQDIRRLIEQETQANVGRKLLDHQAKEGQRLQEEALGANEWVLIFSKAGCKSWTFPPV